MHTGKEPQTFRKLIASASKVDQVVFNMQAKQSFERQAIMCKCTPSCVTEDFSVNHI